MKALNHFFRQGFKFQVILLHVFFSGALFEVELSDVSDMLVCEDSYQDSQASQVSRQGIKTHKCHMLEKMDQYGTKQKGGWFCHVILKVGVISCRRSTVTVDSLFSVLEVDCLFNSSCYLQVRFNYRISIHDE